MNRVPEKGLAALPFRVALYLLQYLTIQDIGRLNRVNKAHRRLASCSELWSSVDFNLASMRSARTFDDIIAMVKSLADPTVVREVALPTSIPNLNEERASEFMEVCPNIKSLKLRSSCHYSSSTLPALAFSKLLSLNLEKLDSVDLEIPQTVWRALAKHSGSLTELSFRFSHSPTSEKGLSTVLDNCKRLTKLQIRMSGYTANSWSLEKLIESPCCKNLVEVSLFGTSENVQKFLDVAAERLKKFEVRLTDNSPSFARRPSPTYPLTLPDDNVLEELSVASAVDCILKLSGTANHLTKLFIGDTANYNHSNFEGLDISSLQCPSLDHLTIKYVRNFPDSQISKFSKLKSLKLADLAGSKSIKLLGANFPELQTLSCKLCIEATDFECDLPEVTSVKVEFQSNYNGSYKSASITGPKIKDLKIVTGYYAHISSLTLDCPMLTKCDLKAVSIKCKDSSETPTISLNLPNVTSAAFELHSDQPSPLRSVLTTIPSCTSLYLSANTTGAGPGQDFDVLSKLLNDHGQNLRDFSLSTSGGGRCKNFELSLPNLETFKWSYWTVPQSKISLAGCTALHTLSLHNVRSTGTTVDEIVQGLSSLTNLQLESCAATKLSLTNHPNLTSLTVAHSTDLEDLDVSGAKSLESIQLKYASLPVHVVQMAINTCKKLKKVVLESALKARVPKKAEVAAIKKILDKFEKDEKKASAAGGKRSPSPAAARGRSKSPTTTTTAKGSGKRSASPASKKKKSHSESEESSAAEEESEEEKMEVEKRPAKKGASKKQKEPTPPPPAVDQPTEAGGLRRSTRTRGVKAPVKYAEKNSDEEEKSESEGEKKGKKRTAAKATAGTAAKKQKTSENGKAKTTKTAAASAPKKGKGKGKKKEESEPEEESEAEQEDDFVDDESSEEEKKTSKAKGKSGGKKKAAAGKKKKGAKVESEDDVEEEADGEEGSDSEDMYQDQARIFELIQALPFYRKLVLNCPSLEVLTISDLRTLFAVDVTNCPVIKTLDISECGSLRYDWLFPTVTVHPTMSELSVHENKRVLGRIKLQCPNLTSLNVSGTFHSIHANTPNMKQMTLHNSSTKATSQLELFCPKLELLKLQITNFTITALQVQKNVKITNQ